jgi:hypothetical protein
MQLGEISFCDKIGYNIKDDSYKNSLLNELEKNYEFKVVQRHHDNIDLNNPFSLKRAINVPHLLSTKTNGNPYLLYLTKHNSFNQCIFIDKKIQHGYFTPRMVIVKLWFQDILFENTLFDGEMVKSKKGNWIFIINDMIVKSNTSLKNLKLVQRLNILYQTLESLYFEDNTSCCQLSVKKYFPYEKLEYMVHEFIPSLDYTCRGIYLKPIYANFRDLLYNFDSSLIKSVVRTRITDVKNKSFLTSHELDTSKNPSIDAKIVITEDNLTNITNIPVPNIKSTYGLIDLNDSTKSNDLNQSKLFWAKKTKMADVYEMQSVDDLNAQVEIACVQNQSTSKFLRSIFNNLTFLEKIKFQCTFNPKFKKWTPIKQIHDA